MPRAYGYAPSDADLWKDQQEKEAYRQKMFDSMDLVSFNILRVQSWLFCHFDVALYRYWSSIKSDIDFLAVSGLE